MPATRKSTRIAQSAAPQNSDEKGETRNDIQQASNGTHQARRKRVRGTDGEDDGQNLDGSPPKKVARSSAKKSQTVPKSTASKPTALKPSPKAAHTASTNTDTNRDDIGNQETFWLLKAEPLPRYENGINVSFSVDDLAACTKPEPWSGVRNLQARNNMRAMRKDDLGFFYHSNAKPSGVVGVLRVVEEAKVDETAFDPKDPYYDAKSDRSNPKWFCVGVEFVKKFDGVVDLATIKGHAQPGGLLEGMQLVTNGRLSVSRMSKAQWEFLMDLAENIAAS